HVYGGTLRALPDVEVAAADVGNVSSPAQQRLHIARLPRRLQRSIRVRAHAGELGEVAVDELPGLRRRYTKAVGEPKVALAIDDGEVHRLGAAALVSRDLIQRDPEHL